MEQQLSVSLSFKSIFKKVKWYVNEVITNCCYGNGVMQDDVVDYLELQTNVLRVNPQCI